MKKITDSYIHLHLRSAMKSLVPEKAEELWQMDVPRADGNEWYLDGTEHRRSGFHYIARALSATAACLVVCMIAFYMIQLRTDATIYLDVNPSVELQKRLTTDIDECLVSMLGEGTILNQNLETTEELKKLSSEYQITPGKAYLLQRIIEKYPELSYKKLAEFTMNQLIPYLQENGVDPEEFVIWSGTPMKKPETEEEEKDSEDEKEERQDEEEQEESEEKAEEIEALCEEYEEPEADDEEEED